MPTSNPHPHPLHPPLRTSSLGGPAGGSGIGVSRDTPGVPPRTGTPISHHWGGVGSSRGVNPMGLGWGGVGWMERGGRGGGGGSCHHPEGVMDGVEWPQVVGDALRGGVTWGLCPSQDPVAASSRPRCPPPPPPARWENTSATGTAPRPGEYPAGGGRGGWCPHPLGTPEGWFGRGDYAAGHKGPSVCPSRSEYDDSSALRRSNSFARPSGKSIYSELMAAP